MDYGCYASAVVFIEVFKRQGVEITMPEAREPMGAHKKVHIRKITQNPAVARRWQDVHGRPPGEDDVERMFQEGAHYVVDTVNDVFECLDEINSRLAAGERP